MSTLNNISYWEKKKVTTEERAIFNYLKKAINGFKPNILHIGIGSSYGSKLLKGKFSNFIGITIAGLEKKRADKLNIDNNKTYLIDKYDHDELTSKIKEGTMNYIIDINLKSFSPSDKKFENMMINFYNILEVGGCIITSASGMKWTTELNLVSNIFIQSGSNNKNILKERDLEQFAKNLNLKIKKFILNVGLFKRKTEEIYILEKL